jgi:hypothetical protein
MLNNFIYAKQKLLFEEALNNGEVLDEAIVFIEDTKEIWNHGTYFDGKYVDVSNIEESIQNIINNKADLEFVNQTFATKSELNSRVFIGTQAEYDSAYANNNIAVGALVIILDGSESSSDTISLLGTAILGKMILGTN